MSNSGTKTRPPERPQEEFDKTFKEMTGNDQNNRSSPSTDSQKEQATDHGKKSHPAAEAITRGTLRMVNRKINEAEEKRFANARKKIADWQIQQAKDNLRDAARRLNVEDDTYLSELEAELSKESVGLVDEAKSEPELHQLIDKVYKKAMDELLDHAKEEDADREKEKRKEKEKEKEDHGEDYEDDTHAKPDAVEQAVAATGATGVTAATMVAVEKGTKKDNPTAKPPVIPKQNNPWGAYKQQHDQALANAKTTTSTTKQTVSRGGASTPKAIANQESEAVTTMASVLAKGVQKGKPSAKPAQYTQQNNPFLAFKQQREASYTASSQAPESKIKGGKPIAKPGGAKGEIIPHSFSRFQPPTTPSADFLSSPGKRINLLPHSAPITLGEMSDNAYDESEETPFNDRGSVVSGNPNQEDDDNDDRYQHPRRRSGKSRPQRQPQQGGGSGSSGGGGGGRGRIGNKIANAGRGATRTTAQGGRAVTQLAARAVPLLANPYVIVTIVVIVIILLILFTIFGKPPEEEGANPLTTNMVCNPPQTTIGQTVVCTITASYPGSATDAVITATLLEGSEYISSDPAGVTGAGAGGTTVTWRASQLNLPLNPVNLSVTITVRTTLDNKTVPILYNVEIIGGGLAGGGDTAYTPPGDNDCGKPEYTRYINSTPIGKNFGDPACDFTIDGLRALVTELEPDNPEFVTIWVDFVARRESSFNPNAFACSACIGTPDAGGAWGLFQMGSSTPPGQPPPAEGKNGIYDRGDVNWRMQTSNAILDNRERLNCSFRYYHFAREFWNKYSC